MDSITSFIQSLVLICMMLQLWYSGRVGSVPSVWVARNWTAVTMWTDTGSCVSDSYTFIIDLATSTWLPWLYKTVNNSQQIHTQHKKFFPESTTKCTEKFRAFLTMCNACLHLYVTRNYILGWDDHRIFSHMNVQLCIWKSYGPGDDFSFCGAELSKAEGVVSKAANFL